MRKLFIDVGHSTRFPGAKGIKTEVALVREIRNELLPLLNKNRWTAIQVPETFGIWDLTANRQLINRINWINKMAKDGDFLLSIHANGWIDSKANGIEVCYMGGSEYARLKAKKMSDMLCIATGLRRRGDGTYPDNRPTASGRSRIGMVRDTRPMALLVECGFVTNPTDMAVSPKAYARGIANFLNVE